MADDQAFEKIKSGVDVWNAWRQNQGQARLARRWGFKPSSQTAFPDLRNADLEGLNLSDCDLTDCDLQGARLARTNLTCATMERANLTVPI